jgi:Periplasmic binding protein
VTVSRRALLGTVAAATVLPPSRGRAQQEPIRIGVLNDQSGLYRDFGGPTSVLAARMAVEDFGGNVFGRPIEVIDADHQNKADLASAIAFPFLPYNMASAARPTMLQRSGPLDGDRRSYVARVARLNSKRARATGPERRLALAVAFAAATIQGGVCINASGRKP